MQRQNLRRIDGYVEIFVLVKYSLNCLLSSNLFPRFAPLYAILKLEFLEKTRLLNNKPPFMHIVHKGY
jgi:hypothetical protein